MTNTLAKHHAEGPRNQRLVALLLIAALALTALVYWPGLHGGYVFDDYANILQNREVHLHSLSWESLREAALASPSNVLVRPLAMLSFGIDWYLTGGRPFEMKLVNLSIHLLNGLLLFALLQRITRFTLCRQSSDASETAHADRVALFVTAAWLLAPINFTAVSYIVQRMESLCQVFVLAGLWGYVAARQRMIAGNGGLLRAVVSIVLGTAIGGLSKESAALLPVYAFAAEWILFRFAGPGGRTDRRLYVVYAAVLFLPACFAAAWVIRHALPPSAWVKRPFTLGERLLTEPRILFDYIRWSLLPTPESLALYHDSIRTSKTLLDPPTTLPSILGIAGMAALVFVLRRRRPLASLGLAWFLCAHILTGTVIPLELVFEHRNYFASIGLYLTLLPFLVPHPRSTMVTGLGVACGGLLLLFAGVTLVRAMDWSNPVVFAMSEAEKNPDSPRTAYELGRTYVVLSRYKPDSPLVPEAYKALKHAATMPGADALPDQGLLLLSARLHRPTDPAVWRRLQSKLGDQPLSAQNIAALHSLSQCAVQGDCDFPRLQMVATFAAALKHTPPAPQVLSIYANYAINVLHDPVLAINLATDTVARNPNDLQSRRNLLLLLQTSGRTDEARKLYEQTLRDVPGAAKNRAFLRWSRDLLNPPKARGDAPTVPKSMP